MSLDLNDSRHPATANEGDELRKGATTILLYDLMTMTRISRLSVLICLFPLVDARLGLSRQLRNSRTTVQPLYLLGQQDRDGDDDDGERRPGISDRNRMYRFGGDGADEEEQDGDKAQQAPGESYGTDFELSPSNNQGDVELPPMEESPPQTGANNVSFAPPGSEGGVEIPPMEEAPPQGGGDGGGVNSAPQGGGDIVDTPTVQEGSDAVDTPTVDQAPGLTSDQPPQGGEDNVDLSPHGSQVGAEIPAMEESPPQTGANNVSFAPPGSEGGVEIPPMEEAPPQGGGDGGGVNSAPQGGGDIVDTPTVQEGSDSVDTPTVDQAPGLTSDLPPPVDGFVPSNQNGDVVDTPEGEGGNDSVEIPEPEPIPEDIAGAPGVEMAPMEDGGTSNGEAEIAQMESGPFVLPFGEEAEAAVFTASAVCASSRQEAEGRCSSQAICKFVKRDETVTTQERPHQAGCVRRCDYPLTASHCLPHEQCYRFVLGCNCAALSLNSDGGCKDRDCCPF